MSKKTTLEEIVSVGLQTGRADRVRAAFGILAQRNYEFYHMNDREQNPMPELREVGL